MRIHDPHPYPDEDTDVRSSNNHWNTPQDYEKDQYVADSHVLNGPIVKLLQAAKAGERCVNGRIRALLLPIYDYLLKSLNGKQLRFWMFGVDPVLWTRSLYFVRDEMAQRTG
jgi:hypothetical protein